MFSFIASIIFLALTDLALAADQVAASAPVPSFDWLSLLQKFMDPSFSGKILAIMVGVQVILRGLAEGLTRISAWTDDNTDNKIAAYLSQAAWLLGVTLGKFGVSVPTLVIQEAADQKAEQPQPEKKP